MTLVLILFGSLFGLAFLGMIADNYMGKKGWEVKQVDYTSEVDKILQDIPNEGC